MVEDNEMNGNAYKGEGVRGWGWALFGVATAIGAKYVLGDGNGLFGGGQKCDLATQRDLTYERELTKANAETAALKAQLDCRAEVQAAERRFEDKLDAIEAQLNTATTTQAVINERQMGVINVLATQAAAFDRMTGRYIIQPVMAASEAALTLKPVAAASTAAASGSGS